MGRKNTLTRIFEDIIDETKDLVDDLIDRAKDVYTDVRDAASNVVDDDDDDKASAADMAAIRSQLSALQAKIEELTALQAAPKPVRSSAAKS
jgi:polyhydroxyalkanoate synthesis regulator phasin